MFKETSNAKHQDESERVGGALDPGESVVRQRHMASSSGVPEVIQLERGARDQSRMPHRDTCP